MNPVRKMSFPKNRSLPTIKESDNKNCSKYMDIFISKKALRVIIKKYLDQCKLNGYTLEQPPEIIMLMNISGRYPTGDGLLMDEDVELIICITQLNIESRTGNDECYLHDYLFDALIERFSYDKYIGSKKEYPLVRDIENTSKNEEI